MNYNLLNKTQLAYKVMERGFNPYGLTKAQMVQTLKEADEAESMTDEELLAYIRSRQAK